MKMNKNVDNKKKNWKPMLTSRLWVAGSQTCGTAAERFVRLWPVHEPRLPSGSEEAALAHRGEAVYSHIPPTIHSGETAIPGCLAHMLITRERWMKRCSPTTWTCVLTRMLPCLLVASH